MCMRMCICAMYLHAHAHATHRHMYATHGHVHVHLLYMCIHAYMHTCMCMYMCMCACVHVCVHACVRACACAYAYVRGCALYLQIESGDVFSGSCTYDSSGRAEPTVAGMTHDTEEMCNLGLMCFVPSHCSLAPTAPSHPRTLALHARALAHTQTCTLGEVRLGGRVRRARQPPPWRRAWPSQAARFVRPGSWAGRWTWPCRTASDMHAERI